MHPGTITSLIRLEARRALPDFRRAISNWENLRSTPNIGSLPTIPRLILEHFQLSLKLSNAIIEIILVVS
jgi:hypothetical protein